MRRITVGFLAFGVVSALLFSGCGGSTGGGGDAADAVSIKTLQLASENTQAAASARFQIEIADDTGDAVMHASGVTSSDGLNGQVVMDVPGRGRAEQRMVNGVLYLDMGDLSFGILGSNGKRWIELDLSQFGELPLGESTMNNPTSALELLEGLAGDVENLGDDTIAGTHATHYRATVDLSEVAANVPGSPTGGTAPVDLWIDDQDRVVKMHVAVGDKGSAVTMEILEFGVPVSIEPPPPDDVMSFSDLLPGLRDGHLI